MLRKLFRVGKTTEDCPWKELLLFWVGQWTILYCLFLAVGFDGFSWKWPLVSALASIFCWALAWQIWELCFFVKESLLFRSLRPLSGRRKHALLHGIASATAALLAGWLSYQAFSKIQAKFWPGSVVAAIGTLLAVVVVAGATVSIYLLALATFYERRQTP